MLVQDGISYLDSRTEFWRQQKPIYARKREKELKKWHPQPTRPINPMGRTRQHQTEMEYSKFILKSLEDIDNGQYMNRYRNCYYYIVYCIAMFVGNASQSLLLSEQAMNTVKSLSEDNLPNKLQYIATLHSCIGNAHLELGNTAEALKHFRQDMEITNTELVRIL